MNGGDLSEIYSYQQIELDGKAKGCFTINIHKGKADAI